MTDEIINLKDVDGTLDNWNVHRFSDGSVLVYGYIKGDKKGRFEDGDYIHTSYCLDDCVFEEGSIIKTRNSTYLLGSPRNLSQSDKFKHCV